MKKTDGKELAGRCLEAGCDSLELNFSCPHGHPERGWAQPWGKTQTWLKK